MTCSIARVTAVIVMVAVSAMVAWSAEEQQIDKIASGIQLEPADQGETLSYWLRSIRDRDDNILLAMDAIRDLGQDAWPAVEELTRIVAEPFTPVRIGVDRDDVIARKLLSIHLRGDAIDALTAIGETASSSAGPLMQWALTVRVIPMNLDNNVINVWHCCRLGLQTKKGEKFVQNEEIVSSSHCRPLRYDAFGKNS